VRLATVQEVLHALSSAFQTRDAEGLLRLFSSSATVTYAGSESGEKATGPTELRRLLTDLLGRPVAYSFDLRDVTYSEHDDLVWLLADGDCTQTGDDGSTETFAYRLTGVLAKEGAADQRAANDSGANDSGANDSGQWRWLLLAGSEPTPG
jgi:ketosteroid isomerase-like protein